MVNQRRKRNTLKKGKLLVLAAALSCVLLLFLAGCVEHLDPQTDGNPLTVLVMLEEIDGVKILSQNPVNVPIGEEVTFTLEVESDVVINAIPSGTTLEWLKETEGEVASVTPTLAPLSAEEGGDVEGDPSGEAPKEEETAGTEAPTHEKMPPAGVTKCTLTLGKAYFPETLRLETYRRTMCKVRWDCNQPRFGSIYSTMKEGNYLSETEITLRARTIGQYMFLGFSVGNTLENGGELVESSSTYTFKVTEDVRIFANFSEPATSGGEFIDPALTVTVPKDKWVIIYHTNGGVLTATGKEGVKMTTFSSTYYHCPNALANQDHFKRDGYVLLGYNTAADGSGTFYAPGWNIVMPERKAISLFCIWVKESPISDFVYEYDEFDNVYEIVEYKGKDEIVVIPNSLGKQILIMRDAFRSNKNLKTLVIPKNVIGIMDYAVRACPNFETLYLSDSVNTISDGSFSECDNFHKLYMMAVKPPHYPSGRNGTYAIKYERLITVKGPKIVITSGSNSAYGINSEEFEKLMKEAGYPYSVVNYGQNASTAATFYIEVISKYINEGDILLHEPEENQYQWGYNEINTTLWQIFEGAYNAFSEVDIRHYTKLFNSFASFNKARTSTNRTYETYTSDTVNGYGDYSLNKVGYDKSYKTTIDKYIANGGYGTRNLAGGANAIKKYHKNLNRVLHMVEEKGGTILISFAAVNILSLNQASQIDGGDVQTAWEDAVDEYLIGTRISYVATYAMDTKYFYNSDNHPTSEGALVRTRKIVKDVVAYLKKQK